MTYAELPEKPRKGVVLHCDICGRDSSAKRPLWAVGQRAWQHEVVCCRVPMRLCNRIVQYCPTTSERAEREA